MRAARQSYYVIHYFGAASGSASLTIAPNGQRIGLYIYHGSPAGALSIRLGEDTPDYEILFNATESPIVMTFDSHGPFIYRRIKAVGNIAANYTVIERILT